MDEAILGRCRRQFPDPRHAAQPRHRAQAAARPRASARSAIPPSATRSRSTRGRRNTTAASSRGSTAWCSASSSTSTLSASMTRARTSGRSATRSGAAWSPASPTRSPTSSSTRPRSTCSCRRCFRRSRPDRSRELAGKLELESERAGEDRHRLQRRGAPRHLRSHHSRRLPHRGDDAAEDALGAADRDAALSMPIRCGRASPSPIWAPA